MTDLLTAIRQASEEPAKLPDGSVEQRFRFEEGFTGFAGHFPGNPVLPAFVQICMARLLWSRFAGEKFLVKSAKFMKPVRPGEEIEMRLSGNEISLRVSGKPVAIIRTGH